MLDLMRQYLINLPTPTTSPLYQVINTTEVLAQIYPTAALNSISIYSTNPPATVLANAYVVVKEVPNDGALIASFQGNSRLVRRNLQIESKSRGSTDIEAESRAEILNQVIDIFLFSNRSSILNGSNSIVRNSTNTTQTGKYDKIANFFPVETTQFRTEGPGNDPAIPLWKATRAVKLEVWVYKGRS